MKNENRRIYLILNEFDDLIHEHERAEVMRETNTAEQMSSIVEMEV